MDNISPAPTRLSPSTPWNYMLDHAYDEMFAGENQLREHYGPLLEHFTALPQDELQRRKQAADLSFLNQGITFTVYGREEGTEQIFPYDLLPRIITAAEWATVERGLTQRITALNLFLKDIYNEGRILKDGIVPREMVYSCKHFRRQMSGLQVPRNVYVAICGTDLIRLENGEFVVLEDNLRVPSRRELHADQPARDEADLPAAVSQLQRPAHRAVHAAAAGHAAVAGAGGPAGAEHRAALAGRLQLGLLRARVPGAPDGHRAGGRPRPGRARQRLLHAHDAACGAWM